MGRGPRSDLGSERTLVLAADRPIVTIGLRDIIVVDAGDVILVAAADGLPGGQGRRGGVGDAPERARATSVAEPGPARP